MMFVCPNQRLHALHFIWFVVWARLPHMHSTQSGLHFSNPVLALTQTSYAPPSTHILYCSINEPHPLLHNTTASTYQYCTTLQNTTQLKHTHTEVVLGKITNDQQEGMLAKIRCNFVRHGWGGVTL